MDIRPPLTELKESKIWQYLDSVHPQYAGICCHFLDHIAPILASIKSIFPYYTRHDAHHGYRVLLRMQEIIDENCLVAGSPIAFTADEALLLVCSAYAHDLGMAVFPGEQQTLLKRLGIAEEKGWEQDPALHEHLRQQHSVRCGQYIADNVEALQFPRNLLGLLDKLMEAHNLTIPQLEAKLGKRFAGGAKELPILQLACILCIADALEFSETRVVEGVLNALKEKMGEAATPALLISYQHNMQAACIRDGAAIGKDGKIIFTGTFDDPEVINLSYKTIDMIETWVRNYTDIDFRADKKRLKVRGDAIVRELMISGFDFERIGIRMRKENIIDLISSNATWTNDSAIVIRELLQNAVEACRYRAFNSSAADNYIPRIDLYFNKSAGTIVLKDNGCGMSRNTILNNFLTVGNSRSFDPSYTAGGYTSLARFGIGFWSVFTICEHAMVETAPFEYYDRQEIKRAVVAGMRFEVSVMEFKDYTVFTPVELAAGTSITLQLKPGFNMEDAIYKIKFHVGCSAIPIAIHVEGEAVALLPAKLELPDFKAVFGAKNKASLDAGVKEFVHNYNAAEMDITIKFFYTNHGGVFSFMFPGTPSNILTHQNIENRVMKRFTGVCGFLFNFMPRDTIVDFTRVGLLAVNAENPRGYQFTLNRNALVNSPQFEQYNAIVSDQIHVAYRKMLEEHGQFNSKDLVRLNQETRSNGGENYGYHTRNNLSHLIKRGASDLVAFKLYKIDPSKTIHDAVTIYLRYEELLSNSLDVCLWSSPIHEIRYLVNINSLAQIYEIIKVSPHVQANSYLLLPSHEADMIADNARDCGVIVYRSAGIAYALFPVRHFSSTSVSPYASTDGSYDVRGVWSGFILERSIEGGQFAFISRQHLILQKGSELAADIWQLHEKKLMYKICEIVNLLLESNAGYADEAIAKYLQ